MSLEELEKIEIIQYLKAFKELRLYDITPEQFEFMVSCTKSMLTNSALTYGEVDIDKKTI